MSNTHGTTPAECEPHMVDVGTTMMAVANDGDLPTALRIAAAWLDDNPGQIYDITVSELPDQWCVTVYYRPERENKER